MQPNDSIGHSIYGSGGRTLILGTMKKLMSKSCESEWAKYYYNTFVCPKEGSVTHENKTGSHSFEQ
jgi:hypothetical protein